MPLPYPHLLLTWLALAAPCYAFVDVRSGAVAGHTKFRPILRLLASKSDDSEDDENLCVSRRSLLQEVGVSFAGSVSAGPFLSLYRSFCTSQESNGANAMGLVHFPCKEGVLMNKYHLMRAGQSGLESQNILSTNPLFMTNTEDGLTELGLMQVEEACSQLIANNINPSVIKYSLASKCIDTSNAIANTLMVGRNRIVPEFTFMDPRGAGYWDGKDLATTEAAIFALDAAEAGVDGTGGRPPANDDGTANETLWDQVIRLRQLMSVLETQYSGDEILLVFPDGTSPALLSCLIAGVDLEDVHAFNFEPGEVRIDVTMKSTIESYAARKTAPQYTQTLEMGKQHLATLRKEQKVLADAREQPRTLLVPSKTPSSPPRQAVVNDVLKAQSGVEDSIAKRKEASMKRRQAYVTESLKRSQEPIVNGDVVDYPKFSDYMPVASLGAIASMSIWRPPREDDQETAGVIGRKAVAVPNVAYTNSTGPTMMAPMASTSVLENKPVTATKSALPMVSPAITQEVPVLSADVGPNVFEDKPVLSKEDRINAANQAMEEYLEQDDGGDDWLLSLKDIMGDE
eukprot:scaffold1624_cov114-Skeletonema_dohrnii-CCMP3373.AAC.1